VIAKLGRPQFKYLQHRLDRKDDLACRAAWRTHFAGRTFGAADEAQPQTSRRERGSNLRRESLPLVGFIEDVKAAAVKYKLEWTAGRRRREKVQWSEPTAQSVSLRFGLRSFHGERRDIDSEYVESALCQPNGIRSGTGADLKRRNRRNPA
jgi:hypothetical protein